MHSVPATNAESVRRRFSLSLSPRGREDNERTKEDGRSSRRPGAVQHDGSAVLAASASEARAPGFGPFGRARTGGNLQSPRPVPHPPAPSWRRSGPWAGHSELWRVDGRSRHERTGTPERRRRRRRRRPPSPDGFSKTSAPALAPAARDAPRSSTTRRPIPSLTPLCAVAPVNGAAVRACSDARPG